VVSDLDRAIAFWRRVLGLEVLWRLEDDSPELRRQVGFSDARMRIAHLRVPGGEQKIELLEYVAPPGYGSGVPLNHVGAAHVCFVVDDVEAEYRRLRNSGVDSFVSEPVRFVDGPDAGGIAVYLRDPDGNTIELVQEPPGEGEG
jgi:catechol 2,3-dioxygenase-like lactoylglutathione lyase family enzyme